METISVEIVYRPLRIGFALSSNDLSGFRKVVRICNALWGGIYNPILAVDRPEAAKLVEVFRPDFLVQIGDDPAVAAFVDKYPYLINPLTGKNLFFPAAQDREGQARLLDIQNMIVHWRENADWKHFIKQGLGVPRWATDDPLADAFLAQFGGFPDQADIGIDYDQIVTQITKKVEIPIESDGPVPPNILDHPRISNFGRFGLAPHYTSNAGWIYPGVYAGYASEGIDLVNFWNLRACGMSLLFMDLAHLSRTAELQKKHTEQLRTQLSGRDSFPRQTTIWSRDELSEQAREAAGGGDFSVCTIGEGSWNGRNIRPMRMHFGEESSLGVVGGNPANPRVTFSLKEKPFSGDVWFHSQRLVASISFIGGRNDGTDYTFVPPCIPELNEFAARTMYHSFDDVRLEPESVGVVISAAAHDIRHTALPIPALFEQIFALGGFSAKPSSSGLITRQLVTRMGGLDGARAFKIPGVRRLLKTHGPNASFSRKGALQLIGSTDPETKASFADHHRLYIEPRDFGTDLTPAMVFSHLVEKKLFRIGVDLKCPACLLTSWTALDALEQQSVCPLCGNAFDATRQLVEGDYAYRRSGVLGLEKNTQGAVPVVLLLQQLFVNLMDLRGDHLFGASYDLVPKVTTAGLPNCETDFCIATRTPRYGRTTLIIGECKDAGGTIDKNDIHNMSKVADAIPENRFDVFILLAKLSPFSDDEIALAKTLNSKPWSRRAIMLSDRELEPYDIFERTNVELGLDLRCSTVKDLAEATHKIYFADPTPPT